MDTKVVWNDPEHPPYITVYHPIAGWKAVMYVWCVGTDDDYAYYEPWQTGMCGHAKREGAVREARNWAEDEEVELRV